MHSFQQRQCVVQIVGHYLQTHCMSIMGSDDADLFARSAFNRYYYSVYHVVRARLSAIRPEWEITVHADIPPFLRSTISKELALIQRRARKVYDVELVEKCRRAKGHAEEVAALMDAANSARKIADYHPEEKVEFGGGRFQLVGISITEAHSWSTRVDAWLNSIASVMRST